MKRWAIAIGVVVAIANVFCGCHRREPRERADAVVLDAVMVRDDLRVDLYLPTPGRPAPWIVFVDEKARPTVATALQQRGIAVALVSLAAKGGQPSPDVGRHLADAISELGRRAPVYGLLPNAVLGGNEAGASLVARLVLDPELGLDIAKVAGVVAMNGEYDAAIHQPRRDAPPFLLLSAHGEPPERAQNARAFTRALESTQRVRSYHIAARDERALADLSGERNDVTDLVVSFIRGEPAPGGPESAWAVTDAWGAKAPLSTEPFWSDERLVARHPVDDVLRAQLARIFADTPRELDPWPCRTYDGIDLADYLDAHPELGKGEWLVSTNARGEELVLSRSEIRKERPLIVIGIDDERNLFRLLVTYNVYRTYTFRPETEPRPLLARPVGAFLHFPHDTSPRVVTLADFALTTSSFRIVESDPLGAARQLPKPLARTLVGEQGCLQCHSLRGVGARSHHLRALDGKPVGGDALPFEEYPRDVIRRFLFEQDDVARIFGVAPIRVDPTAAQQMLAELSR